MIRMLVPFVLFVLSSGFWFHYYNKIPTIRRIAGAIALGASVWTIWPLLESNLFEGSLEQKKEPKMTTPLPPSPGENKTDPKVNDNQVGVPAKKKPVVVPLPPIENNSPTSNKIVIVSLQKALKKKGCYFGQIDGVMGRETIASINDFNRINTTNIRANNIDETISDLIVSDVSMACNQDNIKKPTECFSFNGKTVCE
jgi:hypothetical protein